MILGACGSAQIQNIFLQAPNRAGTFLGISNGFGNFAGTQGYIVPQYNREGTISCLLH